MDKKKLLENFGDDEKIEVINLLDKYNLSYNKDITVFGNDFYTPNIWRYFKNNLQNSNCTIEDDGFFKEAERRMIAFNNHYGTPFPYKIIKIENTSKFHTLSHRDYLGSLLALGIKRSKLGDLLVKNNICYVLVCEEIQDFILCNLETIGKVSCKVSVVDNLVDIPEYELEEEVILVQSRRIDSIVSKLARVSRSKAQDMIEEGKVLLDYNKVREKSSELGEDNRVTIRGIGKFIIGNTIGNSKSGKIKIVIKKYL